MPVLLWCAEEVEPWLNTQWITKKKAYTLGRGRASISVLSGPEILIWTNGPGAALRGWSRSGYLDQEGLKVDPGPDLQSGATISVLSGIQ